MTVTAQFPNQTWDGTSPGRATSTEYAAPDGNDWNQIVAELQASQNFITAPAATTIALSNSWTNKANCAPPSYRKRGKTVILNGAIVPGTVTGGTKLFTLPAGYVPTDTITIAVVPNGSDTCASTDQPRVTILPTGDVDVYGVTGCQSLDLAGVRFETDQ
jgi:hypothetical protein